MSLGTPESEAASIDGVWAYGRNFSVSELGRGHVIRIMYKLLYVALCYKMISNLAYVDISTVEGFHNGSWILSQCMINR